MAIKVIFTREDGLDRNLIARLASSGFEAVHLPLIACLPNPLPASLEGILSQADWVFFTSGVAVEHFEPFLPEGVKLASIGPKTSQVLGAKGYSLDFEASHPYGSHLVDEWLSLGLEKQVILLPQSNLSPPIIADALKEAGHQVLAWPMYDTVPNEAGQSNIWTYLKQEQVIWTFASPSAWQSFIRVARGLPKSHQIAVIGRTTAAAVEASGYSVDWMPETPSIAAMVCQLIEKETNHDIYET